jgi:hypothetical protein
MSKGWKFKWEDVGAMIRRHEDEDGVSSLQACVLARDLGKLLQEKAETIFDDAYFDLLDIIDCFECVSDVSSFDYELASLYDWADVYRVWLGGVG